MSGEISYVFLCIWENRAVESQKTPLCRPILGKSPTTVSHYGGDDETSINPVLRMVDWGGSYTAATLEQGIKLQGVYLCGWLQVVFLQSNNKSMHVEINMLPISIKCLSWEVAQEQDIGPICREVNSVPSSCPTSLALCSNKQKLPVQEVLYLKTSQ